MHNNQQKWAVIVPMANESKEFQPFTYELTKALNNQVNGQVIFIIDNASKDNTLQLCQELSEIDNRFQTVFAPDNRNVVDAYIKGYQVAYENDFDIIIEMDAGLSHDPRALPMFLRVLNEGNECAFGSRFINGGSIWDSTWKRTFLSKSGTFLSNILLGTKMYDMTSGYQGFHRNIVGKFLQYKLRSKAHFYQTELRYLLRKTRFAEIPIHYRAPSPSVSDRAIKNSLGTLLYYFIQRLRLKTPVIK